MAKKFLVDLASDRNVYEMPLDLRAKELNSYYFIFEEDKLARGIGQRLIAGFDADGIPLNASYVDVEADDLHYYPITIGQYGLAVFESYLRSNRGEDPRRFLKFVDWFCENRTEDDRLGAYWLTDVALPAYRNPGPWQSAFAQSRAVSLLLRGYQLTGVGAYLEVAEKALRPFLYPVSEGGVTSFTGWGPFYEEYTAAVPTLVLNGMVFSLCGLYDFVRACPENDLAHRLFWEGIETLMRALPAYDLGFWTRYNYCRADFYPDVDPATVGYHRLHITQLRMLYRLTRKEVFREYAESWARYDVPGNIARMYLIKYRALKKMSRL
ncbi:MAG: hypothetical protein AMJ46_14715 [Latescibacteria bacterium DG_63]|nr:MAG: hypothetical protein AMJ46_14715 [Latescibacteria bacterium DG_63]